MKIKFTMKKKIVYPKLSLRKNKDNKNCMIINKKTTPIEENNLKVLDFFKIKSKHKSSNINKRLSKRQIMKRFDKTFQNKDYRLSRYKFSYSTKKKKINKKIFLKKEGKDKNTMDVSNCIFFSENYSEDIAIILHKNFLNQFKRYLTNSFKNDKKNIAPKQDLNITVESLNKFIHCCFKNFITKYLLNTYPNLVYISKKYMVEQRKTSNYSEVGLLNYKEKPNINLKYSPINIIESKLFYPELTSIIVKYIKIFSRKKENNSPNQALLLYKPNNDFITYINKIRLICEQMGYNLLIKEDEINKLMTFEKIKLINKNYIIGSLKEKNKNYLQIINNISGEKKWAEFLLSNSIDELIRKDEENIYNYNSINKNRTQKPNYPRNKTVSKSQSTTNTTQNLSKKILHNMKYQNKIDVSFQNSILTFIGHNDDFNTQESNENNNSKEYIIAQKYQQNILEKFNKRKNVILFVDSFVKTDDNRKYLKQINSIIPNSKSPIIILTNNLSLFEENTIFSNIYLHKRYIYHQINNEGIEKKENIIYMIFLIIYFTAFFRKDELFETKSDNTNSDDNKNIYENKNKDNNKTDDYKKYKEFIKINFNDFINDNDDNNYNNNNDNYKNNKFYLEKIKSFINSIYINTKSKIFENDIYSSLITLSYIIAIINNYELDNILVYLKNLFQLLEKQLKNIPIKHNSLLIIWSIKNKILEEIEEYREKEDININSENEEIFKLNDLYEYNSFKDYEYSSLYNIGKQEYKSKLINYGINTGIIYNKESYFYLNEFYDDIKENKTFNYISNKEISERIKEDHKFYQSYYNSNIIMNHSDVIKINMILTQIILNEQISLKDLSIFLNIREKQRKNYKNKINNNNNNLIKEKITLLNKIFRRCNMPIFTKYIKAHLGIKYYIEFLIDGKKYYIPDKLLFHNYYNDNYLVDKIQSEQNKNNSDDDDEEDENNELILKEEEEQSDEENY